MPRRRGGRSSYGAQVIVKELVTLTVEPVGIGQKLAFGSR